MPLNKSSTLLAVSFSTLKSISISRNGMQGGLKCSIQAMMPDSGSDLILALTFRNTVTHRQRHKGISVFWGLTKTKRPTVHFLSHLLSPSRPSQLLLAGNNVMLLLPGNASSLEDEKCFIVFLSFRAAVSRSLPRRERGHLCFVSLCVFVWACMSDKAACTDWNKHVRPLGIERMQCI